MGTSRTTSQFLAKLAALPKAVDAAERTAVVINAKLAKDNALKELRKHVPSQRLKNVGKNGAKLNVRYNIDSATGRAAEIRATGPWQFVEYPTENAPYAVTSKRAGGTRRSRSTAVLAGNYRHGSRTTRGRTRGGRSAVISTPWGPRSYAVVKKKRRGRYPWRTALQKTRREVPFGYQKAVRAEVARVLR